MKPLTIDLARTGALVALATGSVLIPLRSLHRSAAPLSAPQSETLAVELRSAPLDGERVNTIGIAINDNNEVVGTAFDGDKQVRAFVVRNKKAALLPLPKGAPMSVAAGINADGIVVGTVGDDKKARGILWHGDKVGIFRSGSRNTSAVTFSKSGAAGVAFPAGGDADSSLRSFAFLAAGMKNRPPSAIDLPWSVLESGRLSNTLEGMLWKTTCEDGKSLGAFLPQAGNANGTLVGVLLRKGDRDPLPAAMKNGKQVSLATPEGVRMAVPLAANEGDVFVGAGITEEKRQMRPVGWSNGKTGFLPVPGGRQGIALGINDAKTVVGAIETENGEAHAAVWKGGKVVDLNKMVDPDSGWTLVQARGINNKGFVVGTAVKGEKLSAFVVGPVK